MTLIQSNFVFANTKLGVIYIYIYFSGVVWPYSAIRMENTNTSQQKAKDRVVRAKEVT
jgi:hypothetical protein